MGQAFRRAAGRVRSVEQSPPSKPNRPPAAGPVSESVTRAAQKDNLNQVTQRPNLGNVLEERDQQYDALLSQMVGRIRTKPGGAAEMGEALVKGKPDRPLPKLRNTTTDSSRYEDRAAPPGTLNVAQLRHIMLLHQGKADDHNGPMDVRQIARRFKLEVEQVEKILQFVSLPPEGTRKQEKF